MIIIYYYHIIYKQKDFSQTSDKEGEKSSGRAENQHNGENKYIHSARFRGPSEFFVLLIEPRDSLC